MYYIYHIPGKKIGVTRNLKNRVTLMQGYKEGEYEVLEQSTDIDYISGREIELQKSYGYKQDLHKYNKLKPILNKMKINSTEQTTTFPYPINKLKGNLMDNLGFKWKTNLGEFELTNVTIAWILANAKSSMFNNERCFIYNKAFYESFLNPKHTPCSDPEISRFNLIRDWAKQRGIVDKGNSHTQYVKLMEEAGELAEALLKKDRKETYDAIGDMIVVLTNLATLEDMKIEDCIDYAYNEIAGRKGKMINGTFVKNTL